MDTLSPVSSTSSLALLQAALANQKTQDALTTAVAVEAQNIQKQQGAAAVQLIEAAGQSLIDVRA